MNVLSTYDIPFNGLGTGDHHYTFGIGDDFFAAFENSEVKGGKACVEVVLKKATGALNLTFFIDGEVITECDRCLGDCILPVQYRGDLAVKFTAETLAPGEEYDGVVLWLKQDAGELNVAQYIYESIVLSLPYQKVHPDGTDGKPGCDPEMTGRFETISEEEFERRFGTEDTYTLEDSEIGDQLRKLKEELDK